MARGINKVILIGNVGKDPDVRTMPSGKSVANVTLATSESWKDKVSGQNQERTEWHRVIFFDRLGEIVGQYVKKGSKIYIEGSIRTTKYQKNGEDRYSTEIIASEMQLLDSRTQDEDAPEKPTPRRGIIPPPAAIPAEDISFDDGGDEIPF